MTITLSNEVQALAVSKAKAAGFADVSEFVSHIIESYDDDSLPDPPAGASYVVNTKEELEQKLLAALESPAEVVTPAYWARFKERVAARAAELRAGSQ